MNPAQSSQSDHGDLPQLSVVVPVHNGADDLDRCLAALATSSHERFDVIVVDDGSDVPIEPVVTRHGRSYLRIEGPSGPARARNIGAQKATGDILVFVDADVCVHHDTLQRMATAFEADGDIDAVVGTYDDQPACADFFSQYKNLFHHYVHVRSSGSVTTFWSGCGAVKRDLFLRHGGFDEVRFPKPSIEDIELGTRMTASGARIVLDDRVRCKHLKRWTFAGILKSDILDRGIPWIRVMHGAGRMVRSLNVTVSQRISVALTCAAAAAALASVILPQASIVAVAALLAVVLINLDFYRYFARRRGLWFALRTVPMHWLYFLYCGACVIAGTALHYVSPMRVSPPNDDSAAAGAIS